MARCGVTTVAVWAIGALGLALVLQGCGSSPSPSPTPSPTPSEPRAIFVDQASDAGVAGESVGFASAFADVDGDGDVDLLVTNSEQSNRLFLNDGQGGFVDATEASGLADAEATSRAAVFADVNGDGILDVFISSRAHTNRLFIGNGDGTFTDRTYESKLNNTDYGQGACFADIDGDLDLDLFVANFEHSNLLFRNDGNGVFEDVTMSAGLATVRGGFACVFGDVDDDGDMDLYVNSDGTNNTLYLNDGAGVFTDVSAESGTEISTAGKRGVTIADFNGDGHQDLLALVIGQTSRLLLGDGTGHFTDATSSSGMAPTGIGQGIDILDFDNDGDIDILIANVNGPNTMYENDGSGVFTDVTARAAVGTDRFGQGIAIGDVNNDGNSDALLVSWGPYPGFCPNCTAANMLLVNSNTAETPAWLKVRPVNPEGHATLLGAQVRLKVAGTATPAGVRQQIDGGSGFCGQNAYEAHFGLSTAIAGGATAFDVEVRCGGPEWIPAKQDVAPNQVVEVTCPGNSKVAEHVVPPSNYVAHV